MLCKHVPHTLQNRCLGRDRATAVWFAVCLGKADFKENKNYFLRERPESTPSVTTKLLHHYNNLSCLCRVNCYTAESTQGHYHKLQCYYYSFLLSHWQWYALLIWCCCLSFQMWNSLWGQSRVIHKVLHFHQLLRWLHKHSYCTSRCRQCQGFMALTEGTLLRACNQHQNSVHPNQPCEKGLQGNGVCKANDLWNISPVSSRETATFLKAGGWLKPASQPQLLNPRILIKRKRRKPTSWPSASWLKQIINRPSCRTAALPWFSSNCLAAYADLCNAMPLDLPWGIRNSPYHRNSLHCTVQKNTNTGETGQRFPWKKMQPQDRSSLQTSSWRRTAILLQEEKKKKDNSRVQWL